MRGAYRQGLPGDRLFSVRFRWVIVVAWLVAAGLVPHFLSSLASVTQGNNANFLPASAPALDAVPSIRAETTRVARNIGAADSGMGGEAPALYDVRSIFDSDLSRVIPVAILVIGVLLGLGILMDTFLVRTLLVPSTVGLLGRWNWWPPRMSRQPSRGTTADPRGPEKAQVTQARPVELRRAG